MRKIIINWEDGTYTIACPKADLKLSEQEALKAIEALHFYDRMTDALEKAITNYYKGVLLCAPEETPPGFSASLSPFVPSP